MRRAARSLCRAYQQGDDSAAREDMALTSLFGGLALANAQLGAVHGFAGPIGGMFDGAHGAICARLLPHVMEINVRALQQRPGGSPALRRYDEIAHILTGNESASADAGVAWVQDLCQTLQVPSLASYGMRQEDLPSVVEKSSAASSMRGNPIELTSDELREILERAL
jgi:alcohol dehydrogenase class IV